MTRSRRLLLQTSMIFAMAAYVTVRPDPVEAAVEAAMCTQTDCLEEGQDCNEVWLSIFCFDCGGDAYPFCRPDIWNCGSGGWSYGCEFAS